jgi:sec-independent protein translocase protein TatB
MFEIGFWEIVLILAVALVVVGPERLPGLVRSVGLWLGKARRILSEVRDEVERELRLEEIKRSIHSQETIGEMKNLADRVKSINSEIQADIKDAMPPPDKPLDQTDTSSLSAPKK